MTDTVRPLNYALRIEPNLTHFTFTGTADIQLQAVAPVDRVTLNILDLALFRCALRASDGTLSDCPFNIRPDREEVTIELPAQQSGDFTITIEYAGRINNQMAGFYRSRYQHAGQERHIAITQFQESDARRALPCMDHPRFKATFDVQIIIDAGRTAISNEAVKTQEALTDGRTSVTFHRTPRMSTYLLFFGVGEFEIIEDVQDVLVRAVTLPGVSQQARFGLEFGRKALTYCEDYYAVPYPLPKMDLIAIPDFAFGAMENWGAITFRENLLLFDPATTSRAAQERICEVTAHEIAHQWFGNLVTPSDWKYLWLNESFATYFGFGVVDHYYPQWEIWSQFIHSQTETAMARDGLNATFAIEIPGGEHVVINTSTAPIIYSKGGSILRQIEGYIGADAFRDGLRHYLKKHEYACAASHHLWEALETVSAQPITRMMQTWIEQPGYPVVRAGRNGNRLTLRQQRFTYLEDPAATQTAAQWMIPVTIDLFRGDAAPERQTLMLDSAQQEIEIADDVTAYKINAGQTGFYRVCYEDDAALNALGDLVKTQALDADDRWGLQSDLYALVRGGQIPLTAYLDFLAHYSTEDAYLPLTSIAGNLMQAYLIMPPAKRTQIADLGRRLIEPVLTRIGYAPGVDEPHTQALLREQLLRHAALYGLQPAIDFGAGQFERLRTGATVHPDLQKSALQMGAFLGDEQTFDWFEKSLTTAPSEHERMNLQSALGCFREPALIERAGRYVLEKIPPRNQFIPLVAMAVNPEAVEGLWPWFQNHLAALETFHPLLYERVLAAFIPVCGLTRPDEVRPFMQTYIEAKPHLADVVKLSLEKLAINLRMRES